MNSSCIDPRPITSTRVTYLATAFGLSAPSLALAENGLAYKYQDYSEGNGRIQVQAHYGAIEQSLSADSKLKLMGVIDTITGATPTGQTFDKTLGELPTTKIDDLRKAWNLDYSHKIKLNTLSLGVSNSRESDYVSNGLSLNTSTDFNDKTSTVLIGAAATDDKVKVFYQEPWAKKKGYDLIAGVSQILDPETTLSFSLSYGHSTGYLNDPYKIIEKNTELLPGQFLLLTFPENRPDRREKWILYSGLNHAFVKLNGAIDCSYRFYHDSFGVNSHTLETTWFQKLGDEFTLAPSVRLYQQSAANFYRTTLSGTSIKPTDTPNPKGPFYSSDFRLSKLYSYNLGLKLIWKPKEWLSADLAYDFYKMKGRDSLTSAEAYPFANIVTAGLKISW